MTVVWSWADLGDNTLQRHNIKQYWLLLSVLSVRKFNPEWKRMFVVDERTSDFIKERGWSWLWDDIKIVNFSDTEYGNLYNIHIYSWPKIYSYGLVDDDVLILDIDIMFLKKFVIPDTNKVVGKIYNHCHSFYAKTSKTNLAGKWKDIDSVQTELYDNDIIEYKMDSDTICYQGSPIYCPRCYTKRLQEYLIEHIQEVESYYNGVCPFDTYQSIEEEFPLSQFARTHTGIGSVDNSSFRHGYVYDAVFNVSSGFSKAEEILNIPVFENYLKSYEQSYT